MFKACSLASIMVRIIGNITSSEDIWVTCLKENISFNSSLCIFFQFLADKLSIWNHTSADQHSVSFEDSTICQHDTLSNSVFRLNFFDAHSEIKFNAIVSVKLLDCLANFSAKHALIRHLSTIDNGDINLIFQEILDACSGFQTYEGCSNDNEFL